MGKFKDSVIDNMQYCSGGEQPGNMPPLYTENTALEQEIKVGDSVRVYDSSALMQPKEGLVLYRKVVLDSVILDIELRDNSLIQVYEIQCTKLNKRLPRVFYIKQSASGEFEVRLKAPENMDGWSRFKEEL